MTLLTLGTFYSAVQAQLEYKKSTDVDYSDLIYYGKNQSWKIDGMAHNDDYTVIFIDVTITSNSAGAILGKYCAGNGRDPKITIDGGTFKYDYISKETRLRTTYKGAKRAGYTYWDGVWYGSGNKGQHAYLSLYFPRIPIGIKELNLSVYGGICGDCAPNPLDGKYRCESFSGTIPVSNNEDKIEKTGWTDASLREYWATNKCEFIEGIYCFISTSDKKMVGSI